MSNFKYLVLSFMSVIAGCEERENGTSDQGMDSAIVFYSPSCPDCQLMKEEVIPHLVAQVGDIEWVDVTKEEGAQRFVELTNERGVDPPSMAPLILYGEHSLWKIEDMHRVFVE